jgi:hypothetical protein
VSIENKRVFGSSSVCSSSTTYQISHHTIP